MFFFFSVSFGHNFSYGFLNIHAHKILMFSWNISAPHLVHILSYLLLPLTAPVDTSTTHSQMLPQTPAQFLLLGSRDVYQHLTSPFGWHRQPKLSIFKTNSRSPLLIPPLPFSLLLVKNTVTYILSQAGSQKSTFPLAPSNQDFTMFHEFFLQNFFLSSSFFNPHFQFSWNLHHFKIGLV